MTTDNTKDRVSEIAHGLTWTVKHSFLAYLNRTPGSRALMGPGVTVGENNALNFGLVDIARPERSNTTGEYHVIFGGDVHFLAHGGMLSIKIEDPHAMTDGTLGRLTVAGQDGAARFTLVTFAVADRLRDGDDERWDCTDVRLTSDGASLFNDVYGESEPFDPFVITVPWVAD